MVSFTQVITVLGNYTGLTVFFMAACCQSFTLFHILAHFLILYHIFNTNHSHFKQFAFNRFYLALFLLMSHSNKT